MPRIWHMYMNLFMHPLCLPVIQYTHAQRTFDHALLTVSLLLHGTPSPDADEVESDEECSKPKMQFSLLIQGPCTCGASSLSSRSSQFFVVFSITSSSWCVSRTRTPLLD